MSNAMKRYMVSVEGIDKSGKGTVGKYLKILGNCKYVILDRGLLSNIAYSKMYGRGYDYDLQAYKDVLVVYLVVDFEDWKARCKMTAEPAIDFASNMQALNDAAIEFDKAGIKVLVYNTSKCTPYLVAKDVIAHLEQLNAKPNEDSKLPSTSTKSVDSCKQTSLSAQ